MKKCQEQFRLQGFLNDEIDLTGMSENQLKDLQYSSFQS